MNWEGNIYTVFYNGSIFLRDKEPLKVHRRKDNYPVENKGKIYEFTKEEIQLVDTHIKVLNFNSGQEIQNKTGGYYFFY